MMELSDEVLRGLLEAAPDALIAVDDTGVIAYANHQTERLFGWPPQVLVGEPVEVLVPPDAVRRHVRHRASYLAEPIARPMGLGVRLSGRRRDGTEFPAEISLNTIGGGAEAMVVAAVRDVTERLELERERERQALEAQREQSHRLESLGQLAGGVAHDFNNLLGVILNYATLAERQVDQPQLRDDLAQIRTAAERAAGLTRQLLAFARREVVNPEALDVPSLVGDFCQLLSRTLGEHIDLRYEAGPSAVVMADRHHLEQVLLNLCLNARDAMPDGGELRVSTGLAELGPGAAAEQGLDAGPYAQITVADDGVGMPAEVLDRAFEPFFTTKAPGEGTGLGLATVYGILQQSGGNAAIRSVPGLGTVVDVLLPAVDVVASAPMSASPPIPAGRERILLVEDEEALRTVVARMLREQGYRVTAVADASAAEQVLATGEQIDLLMSDVVMPGRSGPELVAELVASGRVDRRRVLFISGYAPTEREVSDLPLLSKPFSQEAMLHAVREVIDGAR